MELMKRILFVSNALPARSLYDKQKILNPQSETNQFHNSFIKILENFNTIWVGKIEIDFLSNDKIERIVNILKKKNIYPVFLQKKENELYYEGFCNQTIWPLFHYFHQNAIFEEDYWNSYVSVNRKYADKVAELINSGDTVWINDFHLMLLPAYLRERFPELSIGYSQYIPFPSFEIFRLIPWRAEILKGLTGADLISFHSYDYEKHFLNCVRRILDLETFYNRIRLGKRILKVENFPMGINYNHFQTEAIHFNTEKKEEKKLLLSKVNKVTGQEKKGKIILSIDKLDYTNGITNRLLAINDLFMQYPEYREKISFLMFIIPFMEKIIKNKQLKSKVEELVDKINSDHSTKSWKPVNYFYRHLSFNELVQLYIHSDIALITPLIDKINLMAKEFIASKTDQTGVIIISEMSSMSKEMPEAIIINPYNRSELIEAMIKAVNIPEAEQRKTNEILQERLKRYNEGQWINNFLNSLQSVANIQEFNITQRLNTIERKRLISEYKSSLNNILFLDYDGTLQRFFKDPQKARPDKELYDILVKLSIDKRNRVIIISGRDKETLNAWFNNIKGLEFIAEHGVWQKTENGEWLRSENIDKKWMEIIKPHLEFYVDKTPGSFIENKNYSLVWHYRNADTDIGLKHSRELKEELISLVYNIPLEIMDGDKVIEIKNMGINKGKAALNKIDNKDYGFIFAAGDDWTDEYMFEALSENAYTIKVGDKQSKAKYYVGSYKEIRILLKEMIN